MRQLNCFSSILNVVIEQATPNRDVVLYKRLIIIYNSPCIQYVSVLNIYVKIRTSKMFDLRYFSRHPNFEMLDICSVLRHLPLGSKLSSVQCFKYINITQETRVLFTFIFHHKICISSMCCVLSSTMFFHITR